MWRKLFTVSLLFLLFLSSCYATKLVFVPSSNPHVFGLNKSVSMTKHVQRFENPKKYLKNYRVVTDLEYNKLIKKNKNIKVLSDINLQKIKPFQKYSMPSIDANYLWSKGFTGNGVKIGLVDSGISYNASYANRISNAKDFTGEGTVECNDYYQHGCLVSSVLVGNPIGSMSDNKGVAYDANLVSAKIFNSEDHVVLVDVNFFDVFDWVISKGANYINNSWGLPKYDVNYVDNSCSWNGVNSDGNGYANAWDFYDYNKAQNDKEILLVFAAGNDGLCGTKTLSNDASAYNVLSVGAINDKDNTDRDDDVYADFSSRGPTDDNRKKPDLVAPGYSIYSQGLTSWRSWPGTSAAAPHVTGGAALLSQLGLNPLRVKSLLINSADDINALGWDKYTGWGYINLQKAYDENSFVKEYDMNLDDAFYDFNSYRVIIKNPKSDFFVLPQDQNTKCTIVWRRVFDNTGTPFVQNYDLFLKKSDKNTISNSTKDNVEQVNLSNTNSPANLKVSCLGQCYPDINYALACNEDFNKINMDYYPVLDTNFYEPKGDGNFNISFVTNKISNKINDLDLDLNVDLNIQKQGKSFLYSFKDINNNTKQILDLNKDFFPLSDYNITFDYNYESTDFNTIETGTTGLYLNKIDSNYPLNYDNNNFYLSDFNLARDINFYDNYIYRLDVNVPNQDYNQIYTVDANKITYYLDFNAEDYNDFGRFKYSFLAYNIFGNILDKNISIYVPYFDFNNYYIDYDNNILYYKYDLNDLNLTFYYNKNKDYNIFLDSSEFSVNIDNNKFNIDFNLDYNVMVFKDNLRDINMLSLHLVKDTVPQFITTSAKKDFNIHVIDNDLNISKISVGVDNSPVPFDTLKDGNNYYISGVGSSNYGTHTIDINVFDYAENFASKTYSYTISRPPSSGGGGGGSGGSDNSNLNNQDIENIQNKEIKTVNKEQEKPKSKPKPVSQYDYNDVNKLKDKGFVVLDTKFKPELYLYNSYDKKIKYMRVKVFDGNKLLYSDYVVGGKLSLDSNKFSGKNLLIFGYVGNIPVFKKSVFIPVIKKKAPSYDVNNQKIKPLGSILDVNAPKNVSQRSVNFKVFIFAFAIFYVVVLVAVTITLILYLK